MFLSLIRQDVIAYDNCTDVLCIVYALLLLSFFLGIDVIMPIKFV